MGGGVLWSRPISHCVFLQSGAHSMNPAGFCSPSPTTTTQFESCRAEWGSLVQTQLKNMMTMTIIFLIFCSCELGLRFCRVHVKYLVLSLKSWKVSLLLNVIRVHIFVHTFYKWVFKLRSHDFLENSFIWWLYGGRQGPMFARVSHRRFGQFILCL